MYCGSRGKGLRMAKRTIGYMLLGVGIALGACSQNFSEKEPVIAMAERGFKPLAGAAVWLKQQDDRIEELRIALTAVNPYPHLVTGLKKGQKPQLLLRLFLASTGASSRKRSRFWSTSPIAVLAVATRQPATAPAF